MRIGGSRGPGGPKGPKKTEGAKKTSGADFKATVEAAAAVDAVDTVDPDEPRDELLARFQAIAEGLRDGELEDRKAAIKQVVHAVIEERFSGLQGKGVLDLEDKVADVLDKDPRMAAKLADQFRRLAEGKK